MEEKQLLIALSEMMDHKLKTALEPVHQRLDQIEGDTRHTRVLIEKDVNYKIGLIAEQYTDIARKLERVVINHTDQIQDLKKAE